MSPMTRERIIREIKRTAEANGGRPLGSRNFAKASGIAESASRIFWARWSDALREAGYAPNEPPATYTDAFVAESLVRLTRSLGHYPTWRDWNIERRRDPNFPSVETTRRMGGVEGVRAKVAEYCHERSDCDDVLRLIDVAARPASVAEASDGGTRRGVVYLVKSGRQYKIGKTANLDQRSRQFAIQLPHPHVIVHKIETDDISGIEEYWHRRFEGKRMGTSEWFALTAEDVKAFQRRRKFM